VTPHDQTGKIAIEQALGRQPRIVAAPNVNVEPAVINIQNVEQRKRIVRKVVRDEDNRISEIIEQVIEGDE